ncbi:oxidoreductase, short chain dehydrogenase/reductase family [Pandoraea iniqua]|uniref:Oxidoreductase, short chain dehydrogenase/reductase family n=1 Tax=Pandoraea iniqua TaxID=2508288 RepID=A0A5E4XYS1_9BURK|nr:SDR family oxidoreductase [Pandoraea iniqua]VVE41611.1 oxidoreductase, short chain dehydrogenase/reductase family [Pandoraea iniqua]
MFSLAGKRAVITGGSSGIGLEAARLLVEQGARVLIMGRQRAKLDAALAKLGDGACGVQADVARPEEIAAAMHQVDRQFGGIDILFVNAGISEAPPVATATEAAFDAIMDINVRGVVFTVVHALPRLSVGASIVLTGSVAARKGRPGDPIYAASKGAVRSFGRTLAVDPDILARRIRVNVLTPGATATPLTAAATDDEEVRQYIADMVPMGRWGEAREVAQAVLFLASDASSYVTGAEITVDGGLAHV